jgi:hypothetical protein
MILKKSKRKLLFSIFISTDAEYNGNYGCIHMLNLILDALFGCLPG